MTLKDIRKPDTITQKVLETLRLAIVTGGIPEGERLNEATISLKLNVSRGPIREAFKVLESEGLVETRPRKGAFVTKISSREIEDTYVAIKAINVAAAKLAAKHMTERGRKELRSIMRQIGRITSKDATEKVMKSSHRLHNFIIKASENRLLLKIQKSLDHQQERFRASGGGFAEDDVADIAQEHLTICDALLKGDEARAESLMVDHIEKARLRVLTALEKNVRTVSGESAETFMEEKKSLREENKDVAKS
jgi:DNA-binding GntR family transcriptional regulator